MSRLYSTEEVCALLSVHPSTLRRWRATLALQASRDPAHLARRLYTSDQVLALAEAHHRIAVVSQLSALRLAELEARVQAIEEYLKRARG